MATRTISNAGGNFSAIGAWVEGIVPIAGDAVVATATSGNLTVDVPSACASIILTNYVGTLTFTSTLTLTSTCTFVAGMTIAGTAGALIFNSTFTATSGGKTLTCALTLGGATTIADDWTVNGLLTANTGAGTVNLNGVGRTMTCAGGVLVNSSSGAGNLSGTAKLSITGGTWSAVNGQLLNDVNLAGNVTVSGAIIWGAAGKTLKYVSGTITTTGSTINCGTSSTWDTAGVTWNNVAFNTGAGVNTLSSTLAWSGTLTINNSSVAFNGAALSGTGAVLLLSGTTLTLNNTGGLVTTGTMTLININYTFAGSAGFTVGTLTTPALTASRIYTLQQGNTYVVNTSLASLATSASRMALKSSTPGTKVVFTLNPGATQQLVFCDPTDVDSSAGQTIVSIAGTISNSDNWVNSVTVAGGSPAPPGKARESAAASASAGVRAHVMRRPAQVIFSPVVSPGGSGTAKPELFSRAAPAFTVSYKATVSRRPAVILPSVTQVAFVPVSRPVRRLFRRQESCRKAQACCALIQRSTQLVLQSPVTVR